MKIVWSPTAVEDLKHLRSYIANDDPGAAAKVAKAILEGVENLREHPSMGRPGRVPHTRELVITRTPLIVPYRLLERRIEIIAVLHGARRWPPFGGG